MKTTALIALAGLASVAMAAPVTVNDFGAVNGTGSYSGTLAGGNIVWISVDVTAGMTYLDFDSNDFFDAGTTSTDDSEIGLYDAAGNLIASNDDDGLGLRSVLSFGTGSGLLLGDSHNLGGDGMANGEDGVLPAVGTYYLAISEYNATFGATGFDVTTTGLEDIDYTINVYADAVPTPASIALIGLGGLVATRRRR